MSANKITKQDVKMGRIHRCGNCETKCDDTHKTMRFIRSWGQRTHQEYRYFCCEDCEKYYVREGTRPILEKHLAFYNGAIPKATETLSNALKCGEKIPCLFQTLRHWKHMKRATEMLLSQEHTYSEVAVAFHKARDVAFELSEAVQDEKNEKYILLEYKIVIDDATLCEDMTKWESLSAWF